jgi:hypothetical protein
MSSGQGELVSRWIRGKKKTKPTRQSRRQAMDERQLLDRAVRYMTAAIVELDDVRQRSLATTAVEAMIQVVRQRTGGELIPLDEAEEVQAAVLGQVRERLLGIAKTAAPAMVGLVSEAEVARVWHDALAAAFSIRQ